jgi:hypothetical protein
MFLVDNRFGQYLAEADFDHIEDSNFQLDMVDKYWDHYSLTMTLLSNC